MSDSAPSRGADPSAGAAALRGIELVVFDLAGTTVYDDGQVVEAFTATLASEGIELGTERLHALRGASKRHAIEALLPPGAGLAERAAATYARFCERLARLYRERGVRAIDGAADVFAWLRARGIKVALNTGFDRAITDPLLAALGWRGDAVDATVCSDEVAQGRPAPYLIFHAMEATGVISAARVVNVGDTALDLQAGANARVGCSVGVLSGAHSRDVLLREPHTVLLPSVKQLPELWPS